MNLISKCISDASFQKPIFLSHSAPAWLGHGPFAFWLIENHRPACLVELGTHYGYSYLCFCQQIQAMGLETRATAIDTWKGDKHSGFYDESAFIELKKYHDSKYGAFSNLLRSTFDEALDQFPDHSIDLLHIDGRHLYEDVKHDYDSWKRKLSSRAIVLFRAGPGNLHRAISGVSA
jgi:hypothetical protein